MEGNALKYGALYIRVSTDKQEELSPDAQKRLLLDYAKAHDIFVTPDLIFIENGISGRKADKRPEFQKMIGLAKSSDCPFSSILVWKFSRFARNQEESIVYKSMLRKQHNIDIISITEPIIDGPFGSLIERIIEWMDEYYSVNLSGEVIRGMTEKAMRGGYQSAPCLGYYSPAPGKPFEIHDADAKIVSYIFDQYVNHLKDPTAIARLLNLQGLCTRRGGNFEKRNVQYILRNRFYIGKIVWNGIERDGVHDTFIADDLFQAANDRLDATFTRKKRRSVSSSRHWLSGLVRCGYCGASLSYNRSGPYPTFSCWRYAKGLHPESCGITEKKLCAAVLTYFDQLDNGVDFEFSYRSLKNEKEVFSEKEQYQKELDKLSVRESRIREAYEAGIDTLEEYKVSRERLLKERERLNELIDAVPEPVRDEKKDRAELLKDIRTVDDVLKDDTVDYETKGVFIRSVLEDIVYYREEERLVFHLYKV